MLEWLGGHDWFGAVDCKSGYWQVPLNPQDSPKTAFVTHHGLWEYSRVPFGLKNAPPHFMRCIDQLMAEEQVNGSRGFVDNLLTGGRRWDEYLAR